jgi:hypothetical protein
MHHKQALAQTIRKAFVVAAATAAFASVGLCHSADAARPKGPFNCELGYNALPDDRWANCAVPSTVDQCELGEYLLPDDRWAYCLPS